MSKALPKLLCGGGSAGEWWMMDAEGYAKELGANKCNSCLIEAFAPGYKPGVTVEQVYGHFSRWVKAMRGQGVWTVVHLVNGGDDTFKVYGVGGINGFVDKVVKELGTDMILLCPVAEHKDQSGHEKVSAHCVEVWRRQAGGHLMFNGAGRPQDVPSADYEVLDYHLQDPNDMGPVPKAGRMTLLDTDNGPIIRWMAYGAQPGYWNPARVKELYSRAYAAGRWMNAYQANSTVVDKAALKEMGKAYGEKADPSTDWWDKIEKWWKEIWRKIKPK